MEEGSKAVSCVGNKKGHLIKRSGASAQSHSVAFKRRYCVASCRCPSMVGTSTFSWFKSKRSTEPEGLVSLVGAKISPSIPEGSRGGDAVEERDFPVSIVGGVDGDYSLLLFAGTEEDQTAWCATLRHAAMGSCATGNSIVGRGNVDAGSADGVVSGAGGAADADAVAVTGTDVSSSTISATVLDARLPTLLVLEIESGPFPSSRFEIGFEGVRIVRHPSAIAPAHHKVLRQIQLPDEDVSREHAEIVYRNETFMIRDIGSLNGTIVNGKRLSLERVSSDWHALTGGDVLQLGRSTMKVYYRIVVPEESVAEIERKRRRQERTAERAHRRLERRRAAQANRERRAVRSTTQAAAQSRDAAVGGMTGAGAVGLMQHALSAADTQQRGGRGRSVVNAHAMDRVLVDVVSYNERKQEQEHEQQHDRKD